MPLARTTSNNRVLASVALGLEAQVLLEDLVAPTISRLRCSGGINQVALAQPQRLVEDYSVATTLLLQADSGVLALQAQARAQGRLVLSEATPTLVVAFSATNLPPSARPQTPLVRGALDQEAAASVQQAILLEVEAALRSQGKYLHQTEQPLLPLIQCLKRTRMPPTKTMYIKAYRTCSLISVTHLKSFD